MNNPRKYDSQRSGNGHFILLRIVFGILLLVNVTVGVSVAARVIKAPMVKNVLVLLACIGVATLCLTVIIRPTMR